MSTKDDYTLEEGDTLDVSDLVIGDILEFERKVGPFTYHHCGNYAGNNVIIHKGTAPGVGGVQAFHAKLNNAIRSQNDSIRDVAHGSKVYRNNMLDDIISPSKEESIVRMQALYGEADYNLFYNNCQHFCTKLRYGIAFSREAEMLAKGTFLTSAGHEYTTKMVKVSLDEGDFNIASSDIINKYENRGRVNLSDKRIPPENKDLSVMTFSRTTTNYTSSFESQLRIVVPSFHTGFDIVLFNTSVESQVLRTIASSFKCQPHNVLLIFNTGLNNVSFNASVQVQMFRTNTNSLQCRTYNAPHLLNTGFYHDLFDTFEEAKVSQTITNSFESQPHNAQPLHYSCLSIASFNLSEEGQVLRSRPGKPKANICDAFPLFKIDLVKEIKVECIGPVTYTKEDNLCNYYDLLCDDNRTYNNSLVEIIAFYNLPYIGYFLGSVITGIINILVGIQSSRPISNNIEYEPREEVPTDNTVTNRVSFAAKIPNIITSRVDYPLLCSTPTCNSSGSENNTSTLVIIVMLLITIFIIFINFRRICFR